MNLHLSVQCAAPHSSDAPPLPTPPPRFIRQCLLAVLPDDAEADLGVRFAGAEECRAANWRYRRRRYTPDILTFVYTSKPLHADLLLCPSIVLRDARERRRSAQAHWAHLLVHGALHALGYDHQTLPEAEAMHARERAALALLGIADPYAPPCVFCSEAGGALLWASRTLRIVRVGGEEGQRFPGFCRIISNRHVSELTDLPPRERAEIWRALQAVESILRECFAPDKINLASLGNVVPHLHWHVIPRHHTDTHFPRPIWSDPLRRLRRAEPPRVSDARLRQLLTQSLGAGA